MTDSPEPGGPPRYDDYRADPTPPMRSDSGADEVFALTFAAGVLSAGMVALFWLLVVAVWIVDRNQVPNLKFLFFGPIIVGLVGLYAWVTLFLPTAVRGAYLLWKTRGLDDPSPSRNRAWLGLLLMFAIPAQIVVPLAFQLLRP